MTFRTDWVVDSHPAILDGFVTMFREELDAQKKLEQEQPFVKQFYVVENLQAAPLIIERFDNLDDAMSQYQTLPNHYMKALGVEKNPDPLPGSLDVLQCRNGMEKLPERCALSCKAQNLNCCTTRSSLKTAQRNVPKNPAQSKITI